MTRENRGIGKTTARMLNCIAEALLCPDEWFAVVDHYGKTDPQLICQILDGLAANIGLNMQVKLHKGVAYIRSPISMLRSESLIPE